MMKRMRTGWVLLLVAGFSLVSVSAMAQGRGGPYDPGCPAREYCCEQGVPNIPVGQKCMILHEIREGENLHMLAAYYYGDARAWRVIYQYNKRLIKNPNVIRVGQVVQVYVEPCWAPRYNFEDFKSLEMRRKELLYAEKGATTKAVEVSVELESKEFKVEAPPPSGKKEGATTPQPGAQPSEPPAPAPPPPPPPAGGGQ